MQKFVRYLFLISVVTFVGACAQEPDATATETAPVTEAAPIIETTPAVGAPFTAEHFAQLEWLSGMWEGTGGRRPFYEQYGPVNETRIRILYFADSTATIPTHSSSLFLEDGVIINRVDDAVWHADSLTNRRIVFRPVENATNGIEWTLVGPDLWTARLSFEDGRERVYDMNRYEPPGR